ncbi:MAG: HAD-IA family hydrolase [Sphaerochaeta sp.]|jgi:putative hydrolase of the HAD superfamily|nr:HAD-IA family hydrolase [Sphaerochaeta sp.]MCH3919219.1 HAD-IA family hydrolase [Sphaerochaeta sp.]MCI2045804.1 HAD-IA family hydrolase [Sphaerochaeta sp.]MCI2076270.1 HAD-IA family hydrolase [Sphaerochaeta sp.]MCI2097164.1 HAD-IA family hydrolase [Sphaerochaeta sp.]
MLYVFDMGNVVITHIHCLEAIIDAYQDRVDKDAFLADFRAYEVPLMEGSLPTRAYWEHWQRRFGVTISDEPFATFFHPRPNEDAIQVIRRLRGRGERVVCGSNTFGPHWDILSGMGLTDELFDATYPSHVIRLSKPEPEYYRYILQKEGYTAGQAWFIDDYECNIQAASQVGMRTVLYDYRSSDSRDALLSL